MFKTYLLSFDPWMMNPSSDKILEFIRSNAFTYQFLSPFLGTVFIKSGAEHWQLIGSYNPFLQPSNYTLIQIFPSNANGLLPKAYWDWINSENPPPLLGHS